MALCKGAGNAVRMDGLRPLFEACLTFFPARSGIERGVMMFKTDLRWGFGWNSPICHLLLIVSDPESRYEDCQ